MGAKEEGLEDGGKRAGLDGCVILAFVSVLGLDFGWLDLSERGGIGVVSWCLLVLMVAVCWCVYDGISIVCTLRLSGKSSAIQSAITAQERMLESHNNNLTETK